jgi:hypothetical protein
LSPVALMVVASEAEAALLGVPRACWRIRTGSPTTAALYARRLAWTTAAITLACRH